MVYHLSKNAKDEGKVPLTEEDPEAQWETDSNGVTVRKQSRDGKGVYACCVVLPWVLVIVCLLLMGGIGSWGWGEHYKLQDLMNKQKVGIKVKEDTLPVEPKIPIGEQEPVVPTVLDPDNPFEEADPVNDVIILDEEPEEVPSVQINEEVDIEVDLDPNNPIEELEEVLDNGDTDGEVGQEMEEFTIATEIDDPEIISDPLVGPLFPSADENMQAFDPENGEQIFQNLPTVDLTNIENVGPEVALPMASDPQFAPVSEIPEFMENPVDDSEMNPEVEETPIFDDLLIDDEKDDVEPFEPDVGKIADPENPQLHAVDPVNESPA